MFSSPTCHPASDLSDDCRGWQASCGYCWDLTELHWGDETKDGDVVSQVAGSVLRVNEDSSDVELLRWNWFSRCGRVPLAQANFELPSVRPTMG